MSKITAIELKNFQTVSDRKLIPIRDLTLLFGPNSAGKSAILDCLTFINELCSDKWDNIEDMLTRWARKKEGKYIEAAVGMGIQFEVDRKWEFHNYFSSPEKSPIKISNFYLTKHPMTLSLN
jgi:predicted ATPase